MPGNYHPNSLITKGFWLAGAYNIFGVLTFSQFFTNTLLSATDPAIFSWFGLICIMLWGAAYASVAKSYQAVPYLVLLFFVEKILYVMTWLMWLTNNLDSLPTLFADSPDRDFLFGLWRRRSGLWRVFSLGGLQ